MAYSKAQEFTIEDIRLAEIAKALSHPARVAILKYVAKQNACICNDIVEELPLSQSTISQHLKALRNAGLIVGEIDGPRTCYCLNTDVCTGALNEMKKLFTQIKCC
ncbi:MAG: winged helix-turn-helix transcriptional regulator [Saprospiraceae bacterium]|nr:winged helix-turn-helix transcriptional regulator [Saprospiraceae bacterium]